MFLSIGIPSFIQVKVSGGERSEIHVKLRGSPGVPMITFDGVVTIGATKTIKA